MKGKSKRHRWNESMTLLQGPKDPVLPTLTCMAKWVKNVIHQPLDIHPFIFLRFSRLLGTIVGADNHQQCRQWLTFIHSIFCQMKARLGSLCRVQLGRFDPHPSFTYSLYINHIWEYEFDSFGHLGRQNSMKITSIYYFWFCFYIFMYKTEINVASTVKCWLHCKYL